jgi:hypothetical protein
MRSPHTAQIEALILLHRDFALLELWRVKTRMNNQS